MASRDQSTLAAQKAEAASIKERHDLYGELRAAQAGEIRTIQGTGSFKQTLLNSQTPNKPGTTVPRPAPSLIDKQAAYERKMRTVPSPRTNIRETPLTQIHTRPNAEVVERQREINKLKRASVSAAANRALLKQVVMECLQSMAHEPKQGAKRATPDAGGSGIQSRSPAPAAKNAKGAASAKGKEPAVARTKLPQVYDDHNKWCPWGNDDLRADIIAVFRR